jgi:hypothetical protein
VRVQLEHVLAALPERGHAVVPAGTGATATARCLLAGGLGRPLLFLGMACAGTTLRAAGF